MNKKEREDFLRDVAIGAAKAYVVFFALFGVWSFVELIFSFQR